MKKRLQRLAFAPGAGFTLLELLVVIAIIAVLAGLLLPAISRGKMRAQGAVCAGRLRQLALAAQLYAGDHGCYPGAFSRDGLWTRGLAPYAAERGFIPLNFTDDANSITNTLTVFRCPRRREGTATLGINGSSLGLNARLDPAQPFPAPVGPVAESDVAAPSEMIAFGDAMAGRGPGKAVMLVSGGIVRGAPFPPIDDPRQEWLRVAARVHQGRVNTAHCDGHVESRSIERLFFDTTEAALRRWNRDNQPHPELIE